MSFSLARWVLASLLLRDQSSSPYERDEVCDEVCAPCHGRNIHQLLGCPTEEAELLSKQLLLSCHGPVLLFFFGDASASVPPVPARLPFVLPASSITLTLCDTLFIVDTFAYSQCYGTDKVSADGGN